MSESLTRKALYNLVWKRPITEIAKEYGLSDRGLGKLCERNGIPVPPRGYWAKIKAGQKLKKPPLLFSDSNTSETVLEKRVPPKLPDKSAKEEEKLPQEVIEAMERENTPEYKIKVPQNLSKYHSVIAKWNNEVDYYGRKERLTGIERKSRIILSVLLNALEERHFKISQANNRGRFIQAEIGQDYISISISEYIKRTRREVTPEEKAKSYSNRRYTYDNENTGKLSVTIYDNYDQVKKHYIETDEKPISEMLNEIVAGIIEQIWYVKEHRLIKEERERKAWERQILEWEEENRRKKEEEKLKNLEKQAENWVKSNNIRKFVGAVKTAFHSGHIDKSKEEFDQWEKWALSHANNLDPIK